MGKDRHAIHVNSVSCPRQQSDTFTVRGERVISIRDSHKILSLVESKGSKGHSMVNEGHCPRPQHGQCLLSIFGVFERILLSLTAEEANQADKGTAVNVIETL